MLRVGVHHNNLHLRIMRAIDKLPAGQSWLEFSDGREAGSLIRQGVIDVSGTGSTPPLVAHAAGADIVYLAGSEPRPANAALLVLRNSAIQSIADLAGRRVALVDGSFHTALLATLAERHGLMLPSFPRVDLAPSRSAQVLRQGVVAAWLAMDPHLAAEAGRDEFRALPGVAGIVPNRSLFWSSRRAAEHPGMPGFLEALATVSDRIAAEPERIARRLAQDGEADEASWLRVLSSRDWRIKPAGERIAAEQQQEADLLWRHGVIDRPIRVKDAMPERSISFAA